MMIFPHDDVIEPTYLDKLIAQLDSNPRAVVAFSDMEVIYTDEAAKTIAYDSLCGVSGSRDRASIALNHEGRVFIAYRGVFRATVHENTGGLRRHWRGEYAADIPWCVKLAINGEFIRIREKLYRKYSTKDGLSSQWKHNSLLNWIAVYCSCFQAIFVSNKPLKICLPLYFRTLLSMFSIVGWRVKRSYQKGFMYTYLNAYYGVCSCVRSIAGDRLWGYLRRVKSYVYPASVPRQH
jgi:hypothetical protein